jgi:hypothetical protein
MALCLGTGAPTMNVPPIPELPALPDLPAPPPLDPLPSWAPPATEIAPAAPPVGPAGDVRVEPIDPVNFVEGDAPGMVAAVMASTGTLALSSQSNAMSALGALANFAAAFTPVTAQPIPVNAVTLPNIGDAPVAPDLVSNFGTLPDAPADPGTVALSIGDAPAYDVADVVLSNFTLPDQFVALMPDEPTLAALADPVEPDFTLPAVPSLTELQIPDAPTVTLPVFDSQLVGRPDAPTVAFSYSEIDYQSQMLTAMNAKLATMVLDDTATGLDAKLEADIGNRAASREQALTQRATGEAMRLIKGRGFRVPQSTMTRMVEQAVQGGLKRDASLGRDIAILRAQLAQQNMRFCIEGAISLESRLIDKHNSTQARALEAAKVMVTAEVQIFNAQVQLYNADVTAFGIRAQVFRSRLEAALATVEVYKAQLDAERARGEINKQRVAIYRAQVDGVKAIVETYKSRVDAATQRIVAQRSVVEAFRARVGALDAQVAAKQSEYDAYAARMKVQSQQAQVFGRQVEAYRTRVGAYDTLVKAKIGQQNLQFKQLNEFPLEVYRAKMDAYRIGSQAAVERLKSVVEVFRANIRAFSVQEGAKSEHVDAQIKVAQTNAEAFLAEAETLIRAGQANLQLVEGVAQTAQNNVRTAGQLGGQLAAAAVAAQSVHASISESGSYGVSNLSSESSSDSTQLSSLNSTGSSSSNNTSVTSNNGVSRNTNVSNSHGRSYNRGISNTTSTNKSAVTSTQHSSVNNNLVDSRNQFGFSTSSECIERHIESQ